MNDSWKNMSRSSIICQIGNGWLSGKLVEYESLQVSNGCVELGQINSVDKIMLCKGF